MRGTVNAEPVVSEPTGIIPACAGNSGRDKIWHEGDRDHPRVCGEQLPALSYFSLRKGSSPRVRGTENSISFIQMNFGIIPACAGNRPLQQTLQQRQRDHPRVCGEQSSRGHGRTKTWGSSPRVRGTGSWNHLTLGFCGIIPACAGKSAGYWVSCRGRWDHPRVCGEQAIVVVADKCV